MKGERLFPDGGWGIFWGSFDGQISSQGKVMRVNGTGAGISGKAQRVIGAFTLIELMVVIAIVTILAAMLMPALERARELSRRIVCVSTERQIYFGLATYAQNNDGALPDNTYRDSCGAEHIIQINTTTRRSLTETCGVDPVTDLRCPNNLWWRYRTDYLNCGYLFGYDLLAGHSAPWDAAYGDWESPRRMSGESDLEVMTDTAYWCTGNGWYTIASHGAMGPIFAPPGTDPRQVGLEGTNVLTLDGSVRFRHIDQCRVRRAAYPAWAVYLGIW
jgi:prepilin-type N-terminal cleavage/methylation domain-containing protein